VDGAKSKSIQLGCIGEEDQTYTAMAKNGFTCGDGNPANL
jgi:hypothetical protein